MKITLLPTVIVTLLLISGSGWLTGPADGGKATLTTLGDGASSKVLTFSDAGTNSTATLRLPGNAAVQKASLAVGGSAVYESLSVNATTQADFGALSLSNVDINTSPGSAFLYPETGLNDEFSGSALDGKWAWSNNPNAYDVGQTRAGFLHVVTNYNTNLYGNQDNAHFVYQPANGSFIIDTMVSATPNRDREKAGIMVRQDQNNYVTLLYYYATGATNLMVRIKSNGMPLQDMTNALSGDPLYLRLVKDNRSFQSFYSMNGVSWTFHRAWNVTINDPMRVGLTTMDGGATQYWPADFDYFRFNQTKSPGSLISPPITTKYNVTSIRALWNQYATPANTSISLSVKGTPAGAWQSVKYDTETKLTGGGNATQYKVDLMTSGIRNPTLDDITLFMTTSSLPRALSLGLGTAAPVWTYPGEFSTNVTLNITSALQSYMATATPGGDGNVTIPINVASGSAGLVTVKNITVEYVLGTAPAPPTLEAPARGAFVSSLTPSFKLGTVDPDGDYIFYTLELSADKFCTTVSYRQDAQAAGWSKGSSPYAPGENATYTLQLSLTQGSRYEWRAKAFDGAFWSNYSEIRNFTVDSTPPEGDVQDEGETTIVSTSLTAQFRFQDIESGVEDYEYLVGTSPNASNVFPLSATDNTSVTVSGLSLNAGSTYYFTARARNGAGLWSGWHPSDGIRYSPTPVEPYGVVISSPGNGSRVSGGVEVSGRAWVQGGWSRSHGLQVRVDQGEWKFAETDLGDSVRNWTLLWNSREVADGAHTVQARVVLGNTNPTELALTFIRVTVANAGAPPSISAEYTPESPITISENTTQPLSVRVITGNPNFIWYVDGRVRTGATATTFNYEANFTAAGTHNITVILKEGLDNIQHSWRVIVTNVNRAPVAGIYRPLDLTSFKLEDTISFDSSTTVDLDTGDKLDYNWDYGDGVLAVGSEVSHKYSKGGKYTVVLSVSDGQFESRAIVTVKVTTPSQPSFWDANGFSLSFIILLVVIAAVGIGGGIYMKKRSAAKKEAEAQKLLAAKRKKIDAEMREQAEMDALANAKPDTKLFPALAPFETPLLSATESIPEADATPVATASTATESDIPEAPALLLDEKTHKAKDAKAEAPKKEAKPKKETEAKPSKDDTDFNLKMKDALASLGPPAGTAAAESKPAEPTKTETDEKGSTKNEKLADNEKNSLDDLLNELK